MSTCGDGGGGGQRGGNIGRAGGRARAGGKETGSHPHPSEGVASLPNSARQPHVERRMLADENTGGSSPRHKIETQKMWVHGCDIFRKRGGTRMREAERYVRMLSRGVWDDSFRAVGGARGSSHNAIIARRAAVAPRPTQEQHSRPKEIRRGSSTRLCILQHRRAQGMMIARRIFPGPMK